MHKLTIRNATTRATMELQMKCLCLGLGRVLVLLHGGTVSDDLFLAASALGLALGILVRLTAGVT